MPIWEILVALALSALAADSPTVIDRLAGLALVFGAVKFQRTRYERIVGLEPTALPAT